MESQYLSVYLCVCFFPCQVLTKGQSLILGLLNLHDYIKIEFKPTHPFPHFLIHTYFTHFFVN